MLPLPLFTFRNFVAANVVTAFVYGGVTSGSLAIAPSTPKKSAATQPPRPDWPRCRSRRCRSYSLVT